MKSSPLYLFGGNRESIFWRIGRVSHFYEFPYSEESSPAIATYSPYELLTFPDRTGITGVRYDAVHALILANQGLLGVPS